MMCFSYGSGLAASLFSIKVDSSEADVKVADIRSVSDIKNRLNNRVKLTPDEFTDVLSAREMHYTSSNRQYVYICRSTHRSLPACVQTSGRCQQTLARNILCEERGRHGEKALCSQIPLVGRLRHCAVRLLCFRVLFLLVLTYVLQFDEQPAYRLSCPFIQPPCPFPPLAEVCQALTTLSH